MKAENMNNDAEEKKKLNHACHSVSKLVGHDWKSLFRELMQMSLETECIINEIELKYPGQLREQAFQSLIRWQNCMGNMATLDQLKIGLKENQLLHIYDML